MIGPLIVADDPFAPAPPDEVAELDALRTAIELSRGFTLLFACCNRASHRERLMLALQDRLPGLRIQSLNLREPTQNLLNEVRSHLDSSPPDALFLHGIESWLPAGEVAEDSPFIRNLNASRNYFPRDLPFPLVIWLPHHILTTLARAAPDFCSVRSGLYSFCATPDVRERIAVSLTEPGRLGMASLTMDEKVARGEALTAMLAEYVALPVGLRDRLAESRLLNALATLNELMGNLVATEAFYLEALAISAATLGRQHPDTATYLDNLASLYSKQGRYAEAQPLFHHALAIRRVALGPDHPHTAVGLANLALLYRVQGRYAEAEPLFLRALAISEASLGPVHSDTATALNNLALLYESEGRYEEAEPLYIRALDIAETSLGPVHPVTATFLNNLALLYNSQARHAEAEPLFLRALAIDKAVWGPDHLDTATHFNNLGLLYKCQGRYAEAEPLYHRALAIRETALGPAHPDTATCLNNLAMLYCSQGRYAEAEPLLMRALAVRQGALGPNHPSTAQSHENYAAVLHQLHRDDESKQWEESAKVARKEHAKINMDRFPSSNNSQT